MNITTWQSSKDQDLDGFPALYPDAVTSIHREKILFLDQKRDMPNFGLTLKPSSTPSTGTYTYPVHTEPSAPGVGVSELESAPSSHQGIDYRFWYCHHLAVVSILIRA